MLLSLRFSTNFRFTWNYTGLVPSNVFIPERVLKLASTNLGETYRSSSLHMLSGSSFGTPPVHVDFLDFK